jgi:hypothetical protein
MSVTVGRGSIIEFAFYFQLNNDSFLSTSDNVYHYIRTHIKRNGTNIHRIVYS